MRRFFVLVTALLYPSRLKNRLLRALGMDVARSARVGIVIVQRVGRMCIGEGASVGHFNVFRDVPDVELGPGSVIGQWNWITAAVPLAGKYGQAHLRLGRDAALTSRHYVDCSGGVSIGEFATVAGVRSTFISHGINWRTNVQEVAPISVGPYALVGSNVAFAPGAVIGERSVVGMGSVVGPDVSAEGALIIGERARPAKQNLDGKYFERTKGYVE